MAMPSNPKTPSAEVVGNAFVEQYYHILHTSPEVVFRFYQDSSVLSRPDANGMMTSVATMQGINEKMLSWNYKEYKAEIKTADAQESYNEGVTVLVTGCLTGKDNQRRKFAQTFFLAPQDNGYFVLNDIFRFLDDNQPLGNGTNNTPAVPSISNPEPSSVPKPASSALATSVTEESGKVTDTPSGLLEPEKQLVKEKEEVIVEPQLHPNGNDSSTEVEASPISMEDGPKKSYASIVKVAKGTAKIYVKVAPKKTEKQLVVPVTPATDPEAAIPSSNDDPKSNIPHEEVEGHSVYIRNLPYNITTEQLEAEFKKFGPVKQGGIQIRSNEQQGYCFGFIEFQSSDSVYSAMQASSMTIGGRQVVIERKRTTGQVDTGRGRFPSTRGGYRNEGFRGRGRGYGRSEFVPRDEFSGRGRSGAARGQRGRARGTNSSFVKQNASAT